MTTFTTNFSWPKPSGTDSPDGPGQIGALGDAADATMRIANNQDVFVSLGGCSIPSTSTSYVDITGASKSWTKIGSAAQSDVMVYVGASGFVTVASTGFVIGVNINGIDTDVTYMLMTNAATETTLPGAWVRISSVPAGTYTVKLRSKRNSGSGNLGMSTGSSVTFRIEERLL
jgi:hypothetical protein